MLLPASWLDNPSIVALSLQIIPRLLLGKDEPYWTGVIRFLST
jgi:hypothetical protein